MAHNGTTGYKKLGWAEQAAEKSLDVASGAYASAKKYVPEAVKPRLEQVEERVSSAAAPYVAKAQDAGTTLLKTVDDKVDAVVNQASTVYSKNSSYLQQQLEKQKQFHSQNLESYKTAREAYLKKVEESVEFLKQNGITGAARKAADEVLVRVGDAKQAAVKAPGYLVKQVQEAVDRLLAFGPVHKAVETVRPALDVAYGKYTQYHDTVVARPEYKRTYDMANGVLAKAQETFVYRKAKENLYPLVAPYADPAYETVVSHPYFKQLVQHLTPQQA